MIASQIGQVEPFQPGVDDWDQYTERLEQYFIANGVDTDPKKLAVFLTLIGAKTYALLSGLVAPVKPAIQRHLKSRKQC